MLEIGTGSGYQTAVLARLVATVERIDALRSSATTTLTRLGCDNVRCLATVDDSVIVGYRQIHHGTYDYFTVHNHSSLLYGVHPEDAALGRIKDGSGKHRTVNATVRYGEATALHILKSDLPVTRCVCVIYYGLFYLSKGEFLAVPHDRNDQAFLRAHRHPNIEVMVLN